MFWPEYFPDVSLWTRSPTSRSVSALDMPPKIDWDRHSHYMSDEEQLIHFVINMVMLILCLFLCVCNRLCPRACVPQTQTQTQTTTKFSSVFPTKPPPERRASV